MAEISMGQFRLEAHLRAFDTAQNVEGTKVATINNFLEYQR